MEQAQAQNRSQYRAYTVTREYRLYTAIEQGTPQSEVIANVSFLPPDEKSYSIERVSGSGRGVSIVKDVLHGEAEATKENASWAMDHRNYNFALLGEEPVDGRPCWRLQIRAKKEDKRLVNGAAWIDKETYLVRKVDGDLARNPSWWLKRVHVTVTFSDIDGMWLQTATRAVGDVRIFGRHVFVGQALSVRTANDVAVLTSGPGGTRVWNHRRRAGISSSLIGTGIIR